MKRAALVAIAFFLLFPSGLYARVDTRALVKRAVRAWNAGNYRESLALFTRAHKAEPGQAVYVWGMARCQEKSGHLNRALGGGVLQVLAYQERMDVKNNRTNGIITGYTQQDISDKENKAHKYLTGAYVMYGVGAAAVVGGIVWSILAPKHNTTISAYCGGSSIAIRSCSCVLML